MRQVGNQSSAVVPAKAGTQLRNNRDPRLWVPAFAGTTDEREVQP